MSLTDEIRKLEPVSRLLEPAADERRRARDRVVAYAEDFLDNIDNAPAFVEPHNGGVGLLAEPIGEEPTDLGKLIDLIRDNVDRPGLNPASGGHLGYIPGGGIYHSALGDYLADIGNRFAGTYWGGPGAVRMENLLIDWMRDLAGYPAGTAGNLTSGGSIGNLIGIVAARDGSGIRAADYHRSVIYLTEQAHHSVQKAIRIAGLGEAELRYIPMDERYRMSADALDRAVAADLKAGLRPLVIIAAAGTTDTGAVDPLEAIAGIAARHNVWFHLDGAYGAFFALCDEGKAVLGGMSKSDSIVMDPHKGLFLPYGTGAVLVKHASRLLESFHYQANYMQDAIRDENAHSPADLSPELTKHFRGLRLWLPLKLHGLAPFRAALREKILLARYFHEKIGAVPGFVTGPYPDLSVVTYRYVPRRGDPDAFNERLVAEVRRDGRVFLSSTMLGGRFTLRLAVLSFRTHIETIDFTLRILEEKARLIESTL
jgi:aromatic-L-amino-acid decarboxylase